jgi:tetratricopeptide (TPR) repeat protein
MPLEILREVCCRLSPYMRRVHLSMVLLAASLGVVSCAKIKSRDLIREGNTAYNEGRYEDAIEAYSQSIDLEPDGVTVFWNRACAAEALVLKLKGERGENRRKAADTALSDFQTWYDRLPESTDEDEKLVNDHRLTLLDADERCDDLLQYWFDKQSAEPKEENWYGVIARQYEKCDNPEKTHEWYIKRTKDFPDSVKAWHALAVREFEPLWPDPEKQLPFNEEVPPAERIRVADKVIALLDKATAIDPKFRDAYVWRSMAYTQRQHARLVVPEPELPEERLEAILAREDAMAGWKQQKAVCDLEGTPDCPSDPSKVPEGQACCPPPPISDAEQAEDGTAKAAIEAELKAADDAAKAEAEGANKKKRGRGK